MGKRREREAVAREDEGRTRKRLRGRKEKRVKRVDEEKTREDTVLSQIIGLLNCDSTISGEFQS